MNKKVGIAVIVTQSLIILALLVYALYQKAEINLQGDYAMRQMELAQKAQLEAAQQRQLAEESKKQAIIASELSAKALEECERVKK